MMVSGKIAVLVLAMVAFGMLCAGCCCGTSGSGSGDLNSNDNVAYTGKPCTTSSNCNNGQNGWYCSSGKCAQSSSAYDEYDY